MSRKAPNPPPPVGIKKPPPPPAPPRRKEGNTMNDKVKSVDFTNRCELRAVTEGMKRLLVDLPEISKLIAQQRKITFDAHIEAGFTPDQALELCKSMEI